MQCHYYEINGTGETGCVPQRRVKSPLIIFLLAAVILVILAIVMSFSVKVILIIGGSLLVGGILMALDEKYADVWQERFFRHPYGKRPKRKPPKVEVVDDSHLD